MAKSKNVVETLKNLLVNRNQEMWIEYELDYAQPVKMSVVGEDTNILKDAFESFDLDCCIEYGSVDGKPYPFDDDVTVDHLKETAKRLSSACILLTPRGSMPVTRIPIFGIIHHGESKGQLVLCADLSTDFIDFCGLVEIYGSEIDYEEKIQNNSIALKNLGDQYFNGDGEEIDYKKAVDLYNKSAQFGNVSAYNMLGRCYEEGLGVEKDNETAYEWYRKGFCYGGEFLRRGDHYFEIFKNTGEHKEDAVFWYKKVLDGSSDTNKANASEKLKQLG